ncbi:hypothetical protein N7452_005245 [Penicillium brevicompactum]|uniref:Transcription factor TFIIIC complex subunit Tfc6 n=1 Tax=Penicillium brevicompactum TaxID=5074 RepID=A0A9W9QID3_PENBR|nr:hypothetical protein N7452_005245 [Penicillium brevicompactum]
MPPGRRSGRQKGPRTVYVNDPFQTAGISDEEGADGGGPLPKKKARHAEEDDSHSDDEFVGAASEGEIDEPAEDEMIEDELEAESMSEDDASDPDDMDLDPDIDKKTFKKHTSASRRPRELHFKKRAADGIVVPSADETHSRGIIDPKDHLSKDTFYTLTFGSDERDMMAAIHSRGQWSRGIDSTFPSRYALEGKCEDDRSVYGPTLGVHPDDLEEEGTRGWDWYYDRNTGRKIRERQRAELIEKSLAYQRYLPRSSGRKHRIRMGPSNDQEVFDLGYHESLDFGKAWEKTKTAKNPAPARQGWIFNIGGKTNCMAWAPSQDGLSQYLAVAAPLTEDQKDEHRTEESEPFTAFQPSQAFPGALQIWEFKAKRTDTDTHALDMEHEPQLRQVICADWGDLRRIAWCTTPRSKREEDDEEVRKPIGLLATVWGDGKVRVLDITRGRGPQETEFLRMQSAAFEARPPSTVSTCVTWLSPTEILVGCGNGFVTVWNITTPYVPEPLPLLHRPVHSTYILSITSAYPVSPHIIATVSMDGETRMCSLVDPESETTSTVRARAAAPYITYSPVLQCFVAGDENEFGRMIPIRRFFTTTNIARLSSNLSAMAPASPWHPCALFGSVGGEVAGTNPFRRVLYNKEQIWQQTWFTHEWIPSLDSNSLGMSRFYDGFRAENQKLAKYHTTETKPLSGMGTSTTYDEGTHVTALGWNPNRPCAGWASAALGCGLVRVEDLAI